MGLILDRVGKPGHFGRRRAREDGVVVITHPCLSTLARTSFSHPPSRMTSSVTHATQFARTPFAATVLAVLVLVVVSAGPGQADDIGLSTVRLIESAENSYVIETDIQPQLQDRIGVPVLPEGFANQDTEFEMRGALIHVRYPFTGERALGPEDTILLRWSRTGVLVNARWEDGTVIKEVNINISAARGALMDV